MAKNKSTEQVFRFVAPGAQSVVLVGDFTDWDRHGIRLRRSPDGIWTTSVRLPPGRHRYRFLVDGQWRDDPECQTRLANPFGSEDMIREAA